VALIDQCRRPFYGNPEDKAFSFLAEGKVAQVIYTYESFGLCISEAAKDLIIGMMRAEPGKRLTLEEIARHPWVVQEPSVIIEEMPSAGLSPISTSCSASKT